ncbi:MAG: hypothetical protein ACUVWN_07670 [bacterium]
MIDESMQILQKRVQQVAGLMDRLKEENANLKSKIAKLEDEIQSLKEQLDVMKREREQIKSKIDNATSMLESLDIEKLINAENQDKTIESVQQSDKTS